MRVRKAMEWDSDLDRHISRVTGISLEKLKHIMPSIKEFYFKGGVSMENFRNVTDVGQQS